MSINIHHYSSSEIDFSSEDDEINLDSDYVLNGGIDVFISDYSHQDGDLTQESLIERTNADVYIFYGDLSGANGTEIRTDPEKIGQIPEIRTGLELVREKLNCDSNNCEVEEDFIFEAIDDAISYLNEEIR